MKITLIKIALLTFSLAMIFSCAKEDSPNSLGGEQSEFGEVGNEIDWISGQFGINDSKMLVSELKDGISKFECTATSTDDQLIGLLKMMPTSLFPGDFRITGNTIEASLKAKVTDEGAQVIFEDGTKLTLVKYDAEVGDKYTAEVGGVTMESKVVEKSTEDDYFWGGIMIKVIRVEYNSHTPGVLHIEHVYNHKFGLVGIAVYFEDGSIKYAGAYC